MQNLLQRFQEIKLENALYIVSTPIGNLSDITIRALKTLQEADFIVCEDSRIATRLLKSYDINNKKLITYNDHGDEKLRKKILHNLVKGHSLALISDAGTPLISDPGYKLVNFLRKFNQKIIPIPGPSALNAALCASGLASDNFLFLGFLPTSKIQKETYLKSLPTNYSFIIFESANRVLKTILAIKETLQNRKICLAKELTKIHEEIICDEIDKIIEFCQENPTKLRGEFVIIVEKADKNSTKISDEDLEKEIKKALDKGLKIKELSQDLAQIYDINKKKIYQIALNIK